MGENINLFTLNDFDKNTLKALFNDSNLKDFTECNPPSNPVKPIHDISMFKKSIESFTNTDPIKEPVKLILDYFDLILKGKK